MSSFTVYPITAERLARAGAIAAALWALGGPANAVECVFQGTGADVRVSTRGGGLLTPFPKAQTHHGCEQLRVEIGEVDVYYRPTADGPIQRRRVSAGTLIPRDGAAQAGSMVATVREFLLVLQGGERAVTGSSRGEGEDYVSGALPAGLLAQPAADLVVPLGTAADPHLKSFVLRAAGRELHRQTGAQRQLVLPAAVLRAGTTVAWELEYGSERFTGEFSVEPAPALEALRARHEQAQAAEPDATLRALRVATALAQAGWRWDARALMAQALAR